jgi:hypothetical protein
MMDSKLRRDIIYTQAALVSVMLSGGFLLIWI